MKKLIIFTIFFIFSFFKTVAQERKILFNISYLSNNLSNPGFNLGIQKKIFNTQSKKNNHNFLISSQLGGFIDPKTAKNLFHYYEIGYEKIKNEKFIFHTGISPGLCKFFLLETYEVDNNGNVFKINNAGRKYFIFNFSLGFGKKIINNSIMKKWMICLNQMYMVNYNNTLIPLINIELKLSI